MVNAQREAPKKAVMGKVITFYSYKGGVGRSMALANVGALLAQWGYKTLVIDWDLEAPGLENYYDEFLDVSKVTQNKGLIDLLLLRLSDDDSGENPIQVKWDEYLSPVIINGNGNLSLITAGKRDEEYTDKVRKFDFAAFYGKHDGGQYLEDLREYWIKNYDFVLIDSRTGLTDSSGICSIHMPEILVLIFTPNIQSFNGVKTVAKKAIAGQRKLIFDRFKLRTFPIPSRIENAETALLDDWMKKIAEESVSMLDWLPVEESNTKNYLIEPGQLVDKIKIPYKTLYAYGEKLPVIQRGTSDSLDIGYVYETISACLANDLQSIQLLKDNRDSYVKKAKGEEIADHVELQSKLEEEKRKNEIALQNKLDEEKRRSELEKQEEKLKADKRVKRLKTVYGIVIIFGLIFITVMGIRTILDGDGSALNTEIAEKNDSISKKEDYIDLLTTYNNFNGLSGEEDNLKMLKEYYSIDPAYRDSLLNDIKVQLDLSVSNKFESIMISFYADLNKGYFNAATYFADTVAAFGASQYLPAMALQKQINAILKNTRKVSNRYEKFLSFNSDSSGFKLVYNEKGNYLLDNGKAYDKLDNITTVYFDTSYKIISYTYQTISGHSLTQILKIDLFVCGSSRDAIQRNKGIIEYLASNKTYTVKVRNFKSSPDTSSPYYINNENQIRYNGDEELAEAKKIAAEVKKATGTHLILRENARTVTKNYISIFICQDPPSNLTPLNRTDYKSQKDAKDKLRPLKLKKS